jgi:hypothetical protein
MEGVRLWNSKSEPFGVFRTVSPSVNIRMLRTPLEGGDAEARDSGECEWASSVGKSSKTQLYADRVSSGDGARSGDASVRDTSVNAEAIIPASKLEGRR